jgi:ABC-type lipoprotein release transport system permease subunit
MFAISEGINSSTKELIDETRVELFVYPKSANPMIQELSSYADMDDGRELARNMVEGNPSIRAASPWLIESLYATTNEVNDEGKSNKGTPWDTIPKVYSFTGKGYVPALQGDFGGIDWISGDEMPTATDPFYANGTYDGGTSSENFTHEIVLNKFLAELLDVKAGDTIYINSIGLPLDINVSTYNSWLANATWFKVYGIMLEKYEAPSMLSGLMHLSELQYLTGKHRYLDFIGQPHSDAVNEIYVDLHNPSDKEEVKRWLTEDFEDHRKISVLTSDELTAEFNSFLDIFKGFSTMIIIITSAVVMLFISTIMMISVREQGREIGMLRAIGISKSTIIKYILMESVLICMLGFLFGVILGYIGSGILEEIIINTQDEIPVGIEITSITYDLVLQVSLITLAIGVLASLVPAAWASKLTPVESIRKI